MQLCELLLCHLQSLVSTLESLDEVAVGLLCLLKQSIGIFQLLGISQQ